VIILGLTGSIGMGKTTTVSLFREEGCPAFDTDAAVHALYARGGEAIPFIRAAFPDVIQNEAVNRKKLREHVQAAPHHLQVLESLIHPMVERERKAFLQEAEVLDPNIVVLDVPLLFETGGEQYVDLIVVVTAPEKVQKDRVMARSGMTEDLFNIILSRQIPDAQKRKMADFLIYTDKGIKDACEQVKALLHSIGRTTEREN